MFKNLIGNSSNSSQSHKKKEKSNIAAFVQKEKNSTVSETKSPPINAKPEEKVPIVGSDQNTIIKTAAKTVIKSDNTAGKLISLLDLHSG